MKKHFYIFRHGQTIWNAEGRPQGQSEYPVPLTITGQEQARALAQKLADKKIKLIVSSKAVLEEAAENCPHRAIGIASHGHAISTLVETMFNYKPKSMDNCDYVHITHSPEKHLYEGVELPPDRGY